jgi:hypothetical protein
MDHVRLSQDALHEVDAGLDGLPGPAEALDVHASDPVAEALLLQEGADLVHLAAEPDHHDVREVDVPRVARERPAQEPERLAHGHAAAGLVGQCHDTVDVRIRGQRIEPEDRVAPEGVGNQIGDVGAAIHRRQDADIVARRHTAVGAADALEGGRRGDQTRRPGIDAERVVAGELAHPEIVDVDVPAGRDVVLREADDLAVFGHRLAAPVRTHRDLVAGRDPLGGRDAVRDRRARLDGTAGNDDAVFGAEGDDGIGGHRSLLTIRRCGFAHRAASGRRAGARASRTGSGAISPTTKR